MKTKAEVLTSALLLWGDDAQLDMAIEEMAELTKAILKLRRNNGLAEYRVQVSEEIADVKIMIEQLEILFSNENINNFYQLKLKRLADRVKKAKHMEVMKQ